MQTTSSISSPKISCIYINYRSVDLLEASLKSLFSHEVDYKNKEIIVINNDESENVAIQALAELYLVKLIPSPGNIGFAKAANKAAQSATGEMLFFVNPDTKWHQPVLNVIQKHFTDATQGVVGIGLCSQSHVFEKGNGGAFLSWGNLLSLKKKEKPQEQSVKEVDWVSGGALACTKKEFISLGGFDEQFFMYFEDMDFCKKIRSHGKKVLLDQSVSLIHFRGKSHSSKRSQKHIYDVSLHSYVRKHWPLVLGIPFLFIHTIYRFLYPYGR